MSNNNSNDIRDYTDPIELQLKASNNKSFTANCRSAKLIFCKFCACCNWNCLSLYKTPCNNGISTPAYHNPLPGNF